MRTETSAPILPDYEPGTLETVQGKFQGKIQLGDSGEEYV